MSTKQPINIFSHLLGEEYQHLPNIIQHFHDTPCIPWKGYASSGGSTHFLARVIRKLMKFPEPAAELPIMVIVYYTDKGAECWTRSLGNTKFSSILTLDKKNPHQMCESFGLLKQHYILEIIDNWLCWKLQYCTLFGVKLPQKLSPKIIANEGVDEKGTYQFVAKATLPLIGTLIEYKGYLSKVQ